MQPLNDIYTLLKTYPIRFIDHTAEQTILHEPNDALLSFAIDDSLATSVGNHLSSPTLRMWVHDRTVVLGIPDSRLPHLRDGVRFLSENEYNVIIRNSGGLAVLIDKHVLNMSLIVPNDDNISIHDGYDMMLHFVQQLFKPYTDAIQAYEIEGSYCPGDYDLSIDGIKFAGISQRRIRNGIAIQIYIDIAGSSQARAQTVRTFYELSKRDEPTKFTYPNVNPNVMGTISELVQQPFTVKGVINDIYTFLQQHGTVTPSTTFSSEEVTEFQKRLHQMKKRNEKITEQLAR